MTMDLSVEGAASQELHSKIVDWWLEAAMSASVDVTGYDPNATLDERVSWARGAGLQIGGAYTRFSTKMQNSTDDQVRACVTYAAQHRIYTPPDLTSVDEAVKGSRARRKGLDRLRAIIKNRYIDVLLVFKASRIFRKAYRSAQFIEEEVVEEGVRVVSVSQGIDTADEGSWKLQFGMYGLFDEALVGTIADHVREGLKGTFLNGYVTGALTVGYRAKEVPGARPTNRGHPRTEPEVDPEVAKLINQHFELIATGMPITEGWRRWNQAKGPRDPRSTAGFMRPEPYRKMLSNKRYIGEWEYGRKHNVWSSKNDYTKQIVQPDDEVEVRHWEHLRIVSDELFFKVQKRLANEMRGRHKGRKEDKPLHLWDLVTDLFCCARCGKRFYQRGAGGQSMGCGDPRCQHRGQVRRKEAVQVICNKLADLVTDDRELVDAVVNAAQDLEGRDDRLAVEREEAERAVARLRRQVNLLVDVVGGDDDKGATDLKTKLRTVKGELNRWYSRLAEIKKAECRAKRIITPDEVERKLADIGEILESAASGKVGDDMVYKAADVFRRLVGGRVTVSFSARPGRKRTVAQGVFGPELLKVVRQEMDVGPGTQEERAKEVTIWLREPPRVDKIADEVRRLYEDEDVGFRVIGDRLGCGSGNACLAYRRWYEMRDLPVPPARRPAGRPRKEA